MGADDNVEDKAEELKAKLRRRWPNCGSGGVLCSVSGQAEQTEQAG